MNTPFPRPRLSYSKSMAPHARRAAGAYPYFKLAAWDAVSVCWRDGKPAYESQAAALAAARKPGRYRLSRVTESGRVDLEPFIVPDPKQSH
jgi:hypothetical protein